MKRGQLPQGYTILEVMIFFAITSVMLVSALAIFNNQQERTRFTQALREADADIRGVMNEVASGYYPSSASLSCSFTGVVTPYARTTGGQGQGTSENCVVLGKSIQFGGTNMRVHTIVGRRLETDNRTQVQNLEDPDGAASKAGAQPSVANGHITDSADLSETKVIPSGVEVYDMYQVRSTGSANIGSIAFAFTLASYQAGSSDPLSGSQSIDAIGVTDTSLADSDEVLWNRTNAMRDSERNAGPIVICFSQDAGGGGRRGAIVLANQNQRLTTEVMELIGNEPGRKCT